LVVVVVAVVAVAVVVVAVAVVAAVVVAVVVVVVDVPAGVTDVDCVVAAPFVVDVCKEGNRVSADKNKEVDMVPASPNAAHLTQSCCC
jgi:hypothetical protein